MNGEEGGGNNNYPQSARSGTGSIGGDFTLPPKPGSNHNDGQSSSRSSKFSNMYRRKSIIGLGNNHSIQNPIGIPSLHDMNGAEDVEYGEENNGFDVDCSNRTILYPDRIQSIQSMFVTPAGSGGRQQHPQQREKSPVPHSEDIDDTPLTFKSLNALSSNNDKRLNDDVVDPDAVVSSGEEEEQDAGNVVTVTDENFLPYS